MRYGVAIFGVAALVIIGGVFLTLQTDVFTDIASAPSDRSATTTTDNKDATPDVPNDDPEPPVTRFTTDPVGGVVVALQVPSRAEVSQVQDDIYELKYVGPQSEANTEITDGYYLSLRLATGTTPASYIQRMESGSVATTETTIAGAPALTYDTQSQLGTMVTHYVVDLVDDETILDVAVSIMGTAAARDIYDTEVTAILQSLSVTTVDSAPEIPDDVQAAIEAKSDLIVVNQPIPGTAVESPLTVAGEARGTWFFEASFPLVLTDWDGRIIAEGNATADGEWMTEDFVPFSGTLSFTAPTSSGASVPNTGSLILQKANPSDLPQNDDALELPVRF